MKPDDVPQWAWDQAKTKDGFDYKQDVKIVVARAIVQARSQAFEEAVRIAEEYAGQASAAQKAAFDSGRDDAGNMFWTGQTAALTISQAIRQHSQKGRDK